MQLKNTDPSSQDDGPMIDTNEMARLIGVSPTTIYHQMQQHKLPWDYYQVTPSKRVSKLSDVLAWMEKVRVKPKGNKTNNEEVMPIA